MGKAIVYESGYMFTGTFAKFLSRTRIINGRSFALFKCCYNGCGKIFEADIQHIKSCRTKSCGCLNKDILKKRMSRHGLSNHPIHKLWDEIKWRCNKKNKSKSAIPYANRGIVVCDEWINDFVSFYNWCITNGWGKGLQIDRIDNDGPYAPWNCRFVTRSINCRNKSNNIIFTNAGRTCTAVEHSEISGIKIGTILNRISLGWKEEELLLPVSKKKIKNRRKEDLPE